MLIWPPAANVEDIKLEGDPTHLSSQKIGSNWAVIYKSDLPNNKEAVVVEVRSERYVLFVVRK
jgi:hypothetical protein